MQSKTNPPNLIVGIMHVTKNPWLSIVRDGQLPSWKKFNSYNFNVVYFFSQSNRFFIFIDKLIESMRWRKGRHASYAISYILMFILQPWKNYLPKSIITSILESKIEAFSLKVNIPELTSTMRWKKISFLNYFLEHTTANFVIISTSSSILNIGKIIEYIEESDRSSDCLYAGNVQQSHDCAFTSGSFTLMNRKAVEMLLKNRNLMPVHVMDDIAFGSVFKKIGITPVNLNSLNIDSLEKLNSYDFSYLMKHLHFRLKSGDLSARNDVKIMNSLVDRLIL